MSRPVKNKHGVYQFRVKVPSDLREAMAPRREVVRSLRTKDPEVARERHREESRKQAMVWQCLRAAPGPIPHKTLITLIGDDYRARNAMLDEEPGEPAIWQHVLRLADQAASAPEKMERWYGEDADRLLREAGLAADEASRKRLIAELGRAARQWAENQLRRAGGDYSPDPAARRFPEKPRAVAGEFTFSDAFALWERERKGAGVAEATVTGFKRALASLAAHAGHSDARRLTPDEVDAWCDFLRHDRPEALGGTVSEKTAAMKYLAPVRAILAVAKAKRRLPSNPAAEVVVTVPKARRLRERGFTDAEAVAILSATEAAASAPGRRGAKSKAALRWVPWLCAYTGARVTEMCQLRREDVAEEHGIPAIRIAPDAGSVKTGHYRLVPVHSHLIEMGFLEWAQEASAGPLFHEGGRKGDAHKAASNMGKKVGEWVREETGVTDQRVAPNHGWRHRFKTLARDAGMTPEEMDGIQGHSDGRAASDYGEWTMKALKRAVEMIPRQGGVASGSPGSPGAQPEGPPSGGAAAP